MLFVFLVAQAVGVLVGGIAGDRIGRYRIIWISVLGPLPFTLLLPFADFFWTGVLTVVISLIIASAFASILIYAIELIPERVGLIGGLFYGLNFGLAGIAAAILGHWPIASASASTGSVPSPAARRPADLVPAAHRRRPTGGRSRRTTGMVVHTVRQGDSRGIHRGTLARKSSYWFPNFRASTGSS